MCAAEAPGVSVAASLHLQKCRLCRTSMSSLIEEKT